jgi:hypothetical protein
VTLRDLVFDALFNALENGSFAEGGCLHLAPHHLVADDLVDCDADVAEACGGEPSTLIPHIAAWRAGAASA